LQEVRRGEEVFVRVHGEGMGYVGERDLWAQVR
jgi:hypothetical protein